MWDFDCDGSSDDALDDEAMKEPKWICFGDNLSTAKGLAQLDWTQVVDLRLRDIECSMIEVLLPIWKW
ncbi:hypothetical protein GN958_ATG01652 [Phytophthora infestans]|uniref:Uncharacterized protein n=1 Tax=Phytophthora infestans TaxID=4787 RepID=A0A8S9V8A9_PHYIN|nr:hypothetical protein GN958_ATG01652 [Phytophthora infestans]